MVTYHGSCHCGDISFSFQHEKIDTGLRCNCSICKRRGAVMSAFTLLPAELNIDINNDSLSTYQFASKVARHYFCKNCGVYPFHETVRKPGNYRVNLGCIDDIDTYAVNVQIFDGNSI